MADIKELMQVRRDKMQKLIDNGVNVHPERYERTHQIKEARELQEGTKEDLKDLDDLASLMLDPNKNFDELRYLFYNDKKFRILNTPLISDNEHLELEINN